MDIILIAAMAKNGVIGRDNKLPWHIPEELKLFKKTTMGYPMIMGRKTFDSFPAPLPGRRHIVLSRNPDLKIEGGELVASLDEAINLCKGATKVFIIGGAQIFEHSMSLITSIILTKIDREIEGDIIFPEFSFEEFKEVKKVDYPDATLPFTVVTYQKQS